ncbi:hypothetical protein, partial [Burkholderia pseudomallei]|uniref:hypothetical protein n=1 Tax=Burkholderia pseudomallei TaxID=28450 RepID=UPI0019D6C490
VAQIVDAEKKFFEFRREHMPRRILFFAGCRLASPSWRQTPHSDPGAMSRYPITLIPQRQQRATVERHQSTLTVLRVLALESKK